MKVNCAAIPPELIESELFGHERGAFTGATARKRGLFEMADGGTLFLDEIGDMSPLGAGQGAAGAADRASSRGWAASRRCKVDVRVVAATNRDLEADGRAPARSARISTSGSTSCRCARRRCATAPRTCRCSSASFVQRRCRENGMRLKPIDAEVLGAARAYRWPGNVRELRNVIERLVILSDERIGVERPARRDRGRGGAPPAREPARRRSCRGRPARHAGALPLREFRDLMERDYIRISSTKTSWNISQTAQALGIERTNLHKKMRALGLSRDSQGQAPGA